MSDTLARLAEQLAAQAVSPNLLGYVPHAYGIDGGQAAFHRSPARTRLLLGGNRCLAAGTLVRMADGTLRPIETVRPGERVVAVDPDGSTAPATVLHRWDNGVREVSRWVFGKRGTEVGVLATAEHRMAARHEKGRTGLMPLEQIDAPTSRPRWSAARATGFEPAGERVDEDLALVLGLLLGDGHVTSGRCQFTSADDEITALMRAECAELGAELRGYGGIQFHVTGRDLRRRIRGHGTAVPSYDKRLPAAVLGWSNTAAARLAAGLLLTDGSVWKASEGWRVGFTSVSRDLADGLRRLLAERFGVYGSRLLEQDRGDGRRKEFSFTVGNHASLARLAAAVPLVGRKARLLERAVREWEGKRSDARLLRFRRREPVGPRPTHDLLIDHPSHAFLLDDGLVSANSGKTTAGAVEALWWAAGRHPYRRTPKPPVRGRVVVVDFDNGMEKIVLPELKRWVVPADLVGGSWEVSWDGRERILSLANGSTIEFLTSDQDLEKHAGTGRHFIWVDEECPEPYWNENLARTVSTAGSMWMTMTPLDGQDWSYDRLYLPGTGEENTERDPDVAVVRVRIHDNPHLDPAEIERFARAYAASPDDLAARVEGEYVAIGGLIYKGYDARVHVVEHWLPPADWPFHTSMDHGTVQAAWGWFALDPEGRIICFHELYQPERTVPQLAESVLHFEHTVLGRTATTRTGDQSIRNRQQAGGIVVSTQHDYAKLGLYIELSMADWETGVNRVRQYLGAGPDGIPRLRFTADCPVTAKQIARLRYKTYASAKLRATSNPPEGQVKRDDHAADMLRYFVSSRPDLSFLNPHAAHAGTVPVMPGATTMAPAAGRVAVLRDASTVDGNTVWQVVSETMGGEW